LIGFAPIGIKKGYFSFILVFASVILLLTILSAMAIQPDYSSSLAIERAYSLSMNVKEVISESAISGASYGFQQYDSTHDVKMCMHCTDYFCTYDRDFPNYCDDYLCSKCFRENEARANADLFANVKIILLNFHEFDPDFSVSISSPTFLAFLKPDITAKNGFSLAHIKSNELTITLQSNFISVNSTFPEMVIFCH
jgi:hypothetical protein